MTTTDSVAAVAVLVTYTAADALVLLGPGEPS